MTEKNTKDTSTIQEKLKLANNKVDARIDDIWTESKQNLWELANRNIIKNEQGQTVLSSDGSYREDDENLITKETILKKRNR